MLKEKTTWLLIVLILGISFLGGLDHNKTAAATTVNEESNSSTSTR